jgi:hypothetical protein
MFLAYSFPRREAAGLSQKKRRGGRLMSSEQAYLPLSIPAREELLTGEVLRSSPLSSPPPLDLESENFAEIEVAQQPQEAQPAAQAQTIAPAPDKFRLLFYSMRQLAYSPVGQMDRSLVFYKQAQFMEDFEDDFDSEAAFSSYFPYYQLMSYDQLRTYFTWRTAVRRGNVRATSVSYAFLYIYELLNQIGVATPAEGLEKLYRFWQDFRVYTPALDAYLPAWLKDYHVLYPPEKPFRDFAIAQGLTQYYPTIFGYGEEGEDSFRVFAGFSSYDIQKSIFFTAETQKLCESCFRVVLRHLREAFRAQGKRFEDILFYLQKRKSRWSPFDKALFHPATKQEDRIVRLSEWEEYECRNQCWTFRTAMLIEQGRQLMGFIFKEMESHLRVREGFKHKLTANWRSFRAIDPMQYQELGVSFPQVIWNAVEEYYTKATWRTVSVDKDNLAKIRLEALDTQEKLIIPEEEETSPPPSPPPAITAPPPSDAGGWAALAHALTPTEKEALALILAGEDIREFALHHNLMPEVLADSINDKAMDAIGDAILEMEDRAGVYEEYRSMVEFIVHSSEFKVNS